jgi:hypothetical protein
MEQVIRWITELNRSNHTAFAVLTVLTMAGFGVFVACLIGCVLHAVDTRTSRPEMYDEGMATGSERDHFRAKEG